MWKENKCKIKYSYKFINVASVILFSKRQFFHSLQSKYKSLKELKLGINKKNIYISHFFLYI